MGVSVFNVSAWAEQTAEMDSLVITASGTEKDAFTAPASVTVIPSAQLERNGVVDLTDALRGVPGVSVAGAADGENIFIRGMPSEFTLILVDGKRQNMAQSRTNGTGGIEQFYIPPVSAIERIEVVRGPMSSLYGSDAIGGVINIITKRHFDDWTGELNIENEFPDASVDGKERQQSFYMAGPLSDDMINLQVWGRNFERELSRRERGRGEQHLKDYKARLTWVSDNGHEFYAEGGNTEIESEPRINYRDNISFGYEGVMADWLTVASLAYEDGGRNTQGSDRSPAVTNAVLDAKISRDYILSGLHALTLGYQFYRSELTDQNPGLDNGEHYSFTNDQWALFAEDAWSVTEAFNLTTGIRYTSDENFGGEFTPRIYGLWAAAEGVALTVGASAGYRTPELRQSVEGYYLTTNRGRAVIAATPELEPEKSWSYELGLRFENAKSNLTMTLFHTDFDNKIDSRDTGDSLTIGSNIYDLYEYYNVGEARISGVELAGALYVIPTLKATASYTYIDSKVLTGDNRGQPLSRTPEKQASLGVEWTTSIPGLFVWSSANYFGDQVNATSRGVDQYEGYTTADAGLTYTLNNHVSLKATVNNLADVETYFDEHGTESPGRTYWTSVTVSF